MTQQVEVLRADHVGFVVGTLEPAIRFFVDGLGGTLRRTGEMSGPFVAEVTGAEDADLRTAIVELAGFSIELLEYSGGRIPDGSHPPYARGMAHLALIVTDLDATLDRATAFDWRPQGVPQRIENGPRVGTKVIYVVGPSGETIEFMQPPA